jgi:ABC-2 type transport system permease protein
MKQVFAVLRKELSITFASPIFYAAAFIFLAVTGYFFWSNVAIYAYQSLQAARNPYLAEGLNMSDMVVKPLFGDFALILLLMIPLITMRMYSEEKKSGTIELLFTYPLSDMAALAGKFMATLVVLLALLAGTLPSLIMLEVFGSLQWGVVISGYTGTLLLGAGFIALGIFTSSLTENQIVAAVLSFGALLILWLMGWAKTVVAPPLGEILARLSIINHMDSFVRGLIDTRDVVFYLLFILFWLFLTLRLLNSRFWRG